MLPWKFWLEPLFSSFLFNMGVQRVGKEYLKVVPKPLGTLLDRFQQNHFLDQPEIMGIWSDGNLPSLGAYQQINQIAKEQR